DILKDAPDFPAEQVDYGAVIPWKIELLQTAYWQHRENGLLIEEFEAFRAENDSWLQDFAFFMAMKQAHDLRPWTEWPVAQRDRQPQAMKAFQSANSGGIIEQHAFDQFLFFRQWTALREYANQGGIQIIGDVPIYVAHDSADVWVHPDLFYLDKAGNPTVVSGVPPDYFSETGQLWGNPIYRWDRHAKNGFKWWIQRMEAVLRQIDVIRLDHFRGFAGYWEVPADEETAMNGRWLPGPGKPLLTTLKKHLGELPLIAEDLGVITPDVEELRDDFNLPGMKIFQFGLEGGNDDPFVPHNFNEHCVAYTGTHDNDTSAGWYHNANPEHQAFARYYLGLSDDPTDIEIAHMMMDRLWHSVAAFVLAPMQDVLGLGTEDRMNYPGTTSGNWQWRMSPDALTPKIESWLKDLNESAER
ncbi:MAG TPA: 4-alpha-glucanotransferase, partial [Anaerolineales bacterium]|nr:4-alpha-glucanotransferase [Anaerolineales bacterium]